MPGTWPSSAEVHAAVADRLTAFLGQHGGLVAEIGLGVLRQGQGVLSAQPHSVRTVLVPGACFAAGGPWRAALWPAVAAECLMAAADLFDDVADADPGSDPEQAGVLLTAGAGLLSLAGAAVVRVVDDGASAETGLRLATLFGIEFAVAASGQAANLQPHQAPVDALGAYRQAAAKSGPLGSLLARLGARTGTADPRIVELLGRFGFHLTVRAQLMNDAQDAGPGAFHKADVRAGARTVPLVFTNSRGAPASLPPDELLVWETEERARIAAGGGLAAALALAEAERLRALEALDALTQHGCPVDGLRILLD